MFQIPLPFSKTAAAWRRIAGRLMSGRVPPEHVTWTIDDEGLLPPLPEPKFAVRVPERFLIMADAAAWHDASDRFDRLYALAWRLRLRPGLMTEDDAEVQTLITMEQEVLRSLRRLQRGLALHPVGLSGGRRQFAGWCDVRHDPLELALPHFTRRLSEMDWVIHTPMRSVRSTSGRIEITAAPERPSLPRDGRHPDWATWLQNCEGGQGYPLPAPFYGLIEPEIRC